MKHPKSMESRALETWRIVYGNRKYPHDGPQELKIDVRRGEVIDEDYATAMVAARTTVPLADVRIVRITT